MARFDTIQLGKRARKTFDFPAPLDAENPEKRDRCDLVVLSGEEEAQAIAAAKEYAKGKGSPDAQSGDPHFDLGVMVHTLVRACLDPDVPRSFAYYFAPSDKADLSGAAGFDLMASIVLAHLDRERIVYLHQLYQVWQDECSPWGPQPTEDTIINKLMQLKDEVDPARPFEIFRPATLGSCFLTTVKRLAILLQDKSGPGSSSAPSAPSANGKNPNGAPADA